MYLIRAPRVPLSAFHARLITARQAPSAILQRLYTKDKGDNDYLEAAKRDLREYRDWRQHFKWRPTLVNQVLRDYTLWSLLALLAYYNLNKRQEREGYDADTFVYMEELREKIHSLDPQNRLLKDTIWEHTEPGAEKPTETGGPAVIF
ncbi:hypothetical protein GGI25_000005 [Coemansia spiralis]|uniref:Uncharacterized protein n=2 Tax=Coemansia TaxID=4863 RepID=A0A9W8GFC2_9FUNG|nr:hypothetical protein BX070DRAFT_243401 [Coemansia spiralis]KAJ1989889.1 hypothetical protein EDC05_004421 [Coemansia umbellata]KAJ2623119.1 hypothetical protein GGI26_002730 [Coemansia sp. RSA 1358]KAJ2681052.1 hypothetical protein GGI25_000005 [Coemansia spiralis]